MLVTTASSGDVTTINVLMNSFILTCKWSILSNNYITVLQSDSSTQGVIAMQVTSVMTDSMETYCMVTSIARAEITQFKQDLW